MNSWWLKLYTIPHLKKLLRDSVLATLAVCLGFMMYPEKSALFLIIYGWPFMTLLSGNINGLYANLDFHKMHVPLKELRKAIYLDVAIQVLAYLLIMFVALSIPMYFFVPRKLWGFNPFFFFVGSPAFTIISYVFFFSFLFMIRGIKPIKLHQNLGQSDLKKRKRAIGLFFFSFLAMTLFAEDDPQKPANLGWLEYLLSFNFVFVCVTFCMACFVGGTYHASMKNFNMIRNKEWRKTFFAYSKGFSAVMSLAILCGFLSRMDYNTDTFKRYTKVKSMMVFSDFMPELEPETVRGMLPHSSVFTGTILRNASREVYELPVEEFITENDLSHVAHYLKEGKPSERNLVYLMRKLEAQPNAKDWVSPGYYKSVKHLLVYRWPQAKSLPEELVAEKIVTKKNRAIASDKKTK